MTNFLWCIISILAFVYFCDSAKILVVFPFASPSHNILGEGINRILLNNGHEVTYITGFVNKNPPPNMTYVEFDSNTIIKDETSPFKKVGNTQMSLSDIATLFVQLDKIARQNLNRDNVQKFLRDPNQKFDLVIIEWLYSEPFVGLAAVFDCPLVWFSSIDPHWQVLQLIDDIPNPAYTPFSMSSAIAPFTYFERVKELFALTIMHGVSMFSTRRWERQTYYDVFEPIMEARGRALPAYEDVLYNGSLMLGNSHVAIGKSIRLPQNYIPIGGYHINPEVPPLPDNLKKIFESSKHGVIYFSLGSIVKSKDMPDEIRDSLLKMFASLKYTVIWKFEAEISDLPGNVHVVKWAPQTSILAHRNCKLFITHGGLLSTLETIYFKKPIIGIPIVGDQPINVDLSVKRGFALRVDVAYDMAEKLKDAIEEILGNSKYQQRIEELSFIFHDRPVTPAQELAHWVNHVINTRGAPHLRSPALAVPWYQKIYLDFFLPLFAIQYAFFKLIKFLCCRKKKLTEKNKTSNKKNN